MKISELHPHPQNDVYFDDMCGESWREFVQSIATSGVIEPIVITEDGTIVSGHQRVRACQALGIEDIPVIVRHYAGDSRDDQILKDLIETNIRQRGIGNTNPVKFGRCIRALERIYGVRAGSASGKGGKFGESNNFTDSDLAEQLGITRQTLQNYKMLADAMPEIQSLVESGVVTATAARAIIKQLPAEQQKELAVMLSSERDRATAKQVSELISQLKDKERQICELEAGKQQEVEGYPLDYNELRRAAERVDELQAIIDNQAAEIESLKAAEVLDQRGVFTTVGDSAKLYELCREVETLLTTQLAPLKYQQYFQNVRDGAFSRKVVRDLIDTVHQWCRDMEAAYNNMCGDVIEA